MNTTVVNTTVVDVVDTTVVDIVDTTVVDTTLWMLWTLPL